MKKQILSLAMITSIAMVCHQANKAWCEANGDNSQLDWADAQEWQRQSAIMGVQFRLDNPEAGPGAQHIAWMDAKIKDGWIYGEVKDGDKKTHPCLVSFDALPEIDKQKDALFQGIVDALASSALKASDSGKATTESLTYGQRAVGLLFNPSKDDLVGKIKQHYANIIDLLDEVRTYEGRSEKARLCSVAITEAQGAQMWGVKGLTWKD